jgi:co-chaperonin GroES (HSP10)
MAQLKPKWDYILVKPFPRKDSDKIIVISSKRMHRGQVVRIGPGRLESPERHKTLRPLDVQVGDIVNFGETPLKFPVWKENNETYWILQESDIAFIEEQ